MKSKNQPIILYKSSDQGMFQRCDQATNTRVRLSKANGYKTSCYIIYNALVCYDVMMYYTLCDIQ